MASFISRLLSRPVSSLLLLAALWFALAALVSGQAAAAGQIWYQFSAGTLNLTQAIIERYIWPALWDPFLLWVLQQPFSAVLLVLALMLRYGARI